MSQSIAMSTQYNMTDTFVPLIEQNRVHVVHTKSHSFKNTHEQEYRPKLDKFEFFDPNSSHISVIN